MQLKTLLMIKFAATTLLLAQMEHSFVQALVLLVVSGLPMLMDFAEIFPSSTNHAETKASLLDRLMPLQILLVQTQQLLKAT